MLIIEIALGIVCLAFLLELIVSAYLIAAVAIVSATLVALWVFLEPIHNLLAVTAGFALLALIIGSIVAVIWNSGSRQTTYSGPGQTTFFGP